jgi:hypothetical protein
VLTISIVVDTGKASVELGSITQLFVVAAPDPATKIALAERLLMRISVWSVTAVKATGVPATMEKGAATARVVMLDS